MNIHAEKLKLIEWIAKVQDSKTIEKLLKIRNKNSYVGFPIFQAN
jgi:hypothetical protein